MAYHIYTTDGIILKRTPFGESSISLYILTETLGLIIGSARAVRLSSSKLRPALQEYSHIIVSCIKGKNGWKITNVLEKESFFFGYPIFTHKVLSQISSVLLQMIPGESPHPEVFKTTRSGFEFLKTVKEKDIPSFEILMVLRILYQLGYVVKNLETGNFLNDLEKLDSSILEKIHMNKERLVGVINKALKESHL